MDPSRRIKHTTITLEERDLMQLAEIITDQDKDAALEFLNQVINTKLECALTPSHHTAFEGDTGKDAAHYTQKGEGAHVEEKEH
jgi:hypothetical protein